jgi:hypothetical protein
MPQKYALLSVLYMICVVYVFDRLHNARLWPKSLLNREDVDRLVAIWGACQE